MILTGGALEHLAGSSDFDSGRKGFVSFLFGHMGGKWREWRIDGMENARREYKKNQVMSRTGNDHGEATGKVLNFLFDTHRIDSLHLFEEVFHDLLCHISVRLFTAS